MEKYVERCLDSLQKQLMEDIEIICIDDKSSDKTLEILNARAESDPRIRVIAQEKNMGVAVARNTGIENEAETVSEEDKPVLEFLKETLAGEVFDVKLSKKLGTHPVCLSSEGEVSIEMEKVLRSMPNTDANQDIRAKKILQINREHKIFEKIKTLFESDKDSLKEVSRVLLDEAKLIEGLPIDDTARFVELATKYISQ